MTSDSRCTARLYLILPGEDDGDWHECEHRAGHQQSHGTLTGYGWDTFRSDRP